MSWVATAAVGTTLVTGYLGDRASKRQKGALDAQNAIAEEQLAMAREQWDYYKSNYQPLEQGVIADAQTAGSPELQEAAAGRAVADVRQQYGISRDMANRGLQRYGLDPSDPTYQSMLLDSNLNEAATSAGSANLARENERNLGYTKKIQALSLGKGLPTEASANMRGASAGLGNVAAGYGGIYKQDMNNIYNTSSALAQMPWGKIFPKTPAVDPGTMPTSGIAPNQQPGFNAYDQAGYREGGIVRGKGTGTSDSNVIRASKGEFVVPAEVVRSMGTDFFNDLLEKHEQKKSRRLGVSHGS